jgi:hypothetical protein
MTPSLDEFSQRVADRLFSRHPEWKGRETRVPEGFFDLEIPAPAEANTEHGLVISTRNEELTVGFDAYHDHFMCIPEIDSDEVESGLSLIEQILSEKVVALSFWKDGKARSATRMDAGEKPDFSRFAKDTDLVRIRSWLGTYSADIKL